MYKRQRFHDYINIDENIVTTEAMTISEITDSIQKEMDEEDDDDDDKETKQTPMYFSDTLML